MGQVGAREATRQRGRCAEKVEGVWGSYVAVVAAAGAVWYKPMVVKKKQQS